VVERERERQGRFFFKKRPRVKKGFEIGIKSGCKEEGRVDRHLVEPPAVDLVNDLHDTGEERLHEGDGPLLEGLRKHRVVGVGKDLVQAEKSISRYKVA
jgi:hypothetical protein